MFNNVMVHQTWQYCKELDIDLTMDIEDFELPWQGDQEIMRIFLQASILGQNLTEFESMLYVPTSNIPVQYLQWHRDSNQPPNVGGESTMYQHI